MSPLLIGIMVMLKDSVVGVVPAGLSLLAFIKVAVLPYPVFFGLSLMEIVEVTALSIPFVGYVLDGDDLIFVASLLLAIEVAELSNLGVEAVKRQ